MRPLSGPGQRRGHLQATSAGRLSLPMLVRCSSACMTGLRLWSTWTGPEAATTCTACWPPSCYAACVRAAPLTMCRSWRPVTRLPAQAERLLTRVEHQARRPQAGGCTLHQDPHCGHAGEQMCFAANVMAMWQMAPVFGWVLCKMASSFPAVPLIAQGVPLYICKVWPV